MVFSSRYRKAPLIGGFYGLFKGIRLGPVGGGGQSELPASSIFSKSFSLNIQYAKVSLFWGSLS